MSVDAMMWVSDIQVGKSSYKAVLVALCNFHHQKKGTCTPSIESLASFTELNRKTVMPALDWLKESGLIDFEKANRRYRNYTLNFDAKSPKNGTIRNRDKSPNLGTKGKAPIVPKTDTHSPKNGTIEENPIVPTAKSHSPKNGLPKSQPLDHKQVTGTKQDNTPPYSGPTLQTVTDYFAIHAPGIDPETFHSYYESIGWMKANQPITNWTSLISIWKKRQHEFDQEKQNANTKNRSGQSKDSRRLSAVERVKQARYRDRS